MNEHIYRGISELPCTVGDITIGEDSRFFTLENRRIVGNVTIGRGCSHYTLRNLRIEGGSLRILGLNFHGVFQGIWIDHAPSHGVYAGGYGTDPSDVCNALVFQGVFARDCGAWGWLMVQQTGLVMHGCSADQNGAGGFLFNGCRGTYGLTAESNHGTGIHLYDSKGLLVAPFVATIDGHADIVINGDSTIQRIG